MAPVDWNYDSVLAARNLYLENSESYEKSASYSAAAKEIRRMCEMELMLGKPDIVVHLLYRSLLLEKKATNVTGEAETRGFLAYVLSKLGKPKESSQNLRTAINLIELVDDPGGRATVHFYAGESFYLNQDLPNLRTHYDQAFKLYQTAGDRKGMAKALTAMAYASMAGDETLAGIELASQSLKLWRDLGDRRGEALSLTALGLAQLRSGETNAAESSLRAAESLFPESLDRTEKAVLTYSLGRLYENFDVCDQALSYYRQSLELLDFEEDISLVIGNLWTLSAIATACGDPVIEPRKLAEKALRLAQQLDKKDDIASTYTTLGEICLRENDTGKALENYLKAEKIFSKHKYLLSTSRTLNRLGHIYVKIGDYDKALDYFKKALALNRQIKNSSGEADMLFRIAEIHHLQGNEPEALAVLENSMSIVKSLAGEIANTQLKTSYSSKVHDRYELYINLLMAQGQRNQEEFINKALQANEDSRSRVMLENLRLAGARITMDAPLAIISREKKASGLLHEKLNILTKLMSSDAPSEFVKKISDEVSVAETELQNIKAALKQTSPIYSAIKNPAPFDVGEFQAQVLDDNSLLLEFSLGKEESYLWVVGKSTFDSYVLPPREQIESRIERLRSLLNQGSMLPNEAVDVFQKRVADAEAEYLHEARTLSNELLGQAADKLTGKRLIVVADGKIHYFPLAALPFPNSATDDPILLTNEVVYEPSAAALMIIKKMSASGKVPEKGLFLVSDPVYSKLDDRLNGSANSGFVATVLGNFRSFDSLESLPRLPASLEEARSITEVVGSAGTTGHTGFAANRENILNAGIGDYKVIHFATHGLLDEKRPELSGIALSLFDETGQQQDGGFIRLQDVYGMNLNADLVVLSACDTGLGKEIKGEGLMSLNNAFLQAGAKSVVSSLWRVDDTVTKILMTDFYSGMASENLTSSEALRQAQIKLRKDPRFSSPFYWASFTAQGNFNTAPQLSRSYNTWILAVGLGLISLCGIYWLRRSRNCKAGKISIQP